MDPRIAESIRERSRRPVRSKRYNRQSYIEDKRPPKRLFTPEIKRFLKDWLIRRRDNPYPNREEKKSLAIQTGLTYIQVCNWFANWRRKLKNSGLQSQRKSWGNLIKSYNNQVHGNVEHFSICSEDSIWQELDAANESRNKSGLNKKYDFNLLSNELNEVNVNSNQKLNSLLNSRSIQRSNLTDDIYYLSKNNNNSAIDSLYYSSSKLSKEKDNPFSQNSNKYKNHIIEKYLRDCQKPENYISDVQEVNDSCGDITRSSMISKWLESAANFKPNENNYLNWTLDKTQKKKTKKLTKVDDSVELHGKEELDAAEALTTLANAHSA